MRQALRDRPAAVCGQLAARSTSTYEQTELRSSCIRDAWENAIKQRDGFWVGVLYLDTSKHPGPSPTSSVHAQPHPLLAIIVAMASLTATSRAQVVSRGPARSCVSRPATLSRSSRAVQVRAETATEAPKWTEPTLNPDTPSPIFGGSTGGLLRKAQVIPLDQTSSRSTSCTLGAQELISAVACAG